MWEEGRRSFRHPGLKEEETGPIPMSEEEGLGFQGPWRDFWEPLCREVSIRLGGDEGTRVPGLELRARVLTLGSGRQGRS